ncbi:lactonase family protein [Demequina sp.]|uniref:lactonase family protein n=1 Tax=Demequina sp. TaxID=2050685 RepID=UPI003D0B939C
MSEQLWWGTYPPLGLGTPVGKGEGLYLQQGPDAALALPLDAPSFVVAHPSLPLLYVVSEAAESSLHVVSVESAPTVLATVPTGGADACHILLAGDASVAYVSHYSSGDVAVVQLGADGLPVADAPQQLLGHEGNGPREDRQGGPHAHSAGFAPGGKHVLVADLGTDELRRYRVADRGLLEADGIAATLPPGAGPRHFAVRGENIYVVCELDHQLRTYRWSAADAEADLIAEVPTTTAPQRTGNDINDAHVALVEGADRDVLLVSVRGVDVIALFDLSPEGEARYRTSLDVGEWPRYFAAIGDRLHVGCERGHEVRSYDLAQVLSLPAENSVGGMAALPYETATVTSPACVVSQPPA